MSGADADAEVRPDVCCAALAAWNDRMLAGIEVEPLRVSCRITSPICLPERRLALDGLLAWAVVVATEQPFALTPRECAPVEIPVAREPAGRFHLASFAEFAVARHGRSWTNRKFPLNEAQEMGDPVTMRRILVTGGTTKSFRIPRETMTIEGPILWYCVGNRALIEGLLPLVSYLGKKRNTGLGRVESGSWRVEPATPWEGGGFPVVRDGAPLRTLPLDWPGLVVYDAGHDALTYPYRKAFEQSCARPCAGG